MTQQDELGRLDTKLNDSKWLRMTQDIYGHGFEWLTLTLEESSL